MEQEKQRPLYLLPGGERIGRVFGIRRIFWKYFLARVMAGELNWQHALAPLIEGGVAVRVEGTRRGRIGGERGNEGKGWRAVGIDEAWLGQGWAVYVAVGEIQMGRESFMQKTPDPFEFARLLECPQSVNLNAEMNWIAQGASSQGFGMRK